MGLDLWNQTDIRRVLDGLASAGADRGPEYHRALCDVALSFGVLTEGRVITRRGLYDALRTLIDLGAADSLAYLGGEARGMLDDHNL